jgi:hypothetical protein
MPRLLAISSLAALYLVASAGCAHHAADTAPATAARPPVSAKTDRDTVPDKIASQREAAGLDQNADDARWGVGPAQALKQREKQQAAQSSSNKATNVTGVPTRTPAPSTAITAP